MCVMVVTGWLNWQSVGFEIQRPEVRTPPGAQENLVRVIPCLLVGLTRCRIAQPPCVHALIRMITCAC